MAEPRLLFKYFSLGGAARDHTARAITHRELYFQSPARFNDPFDCAPAADVQGITSDQAIAILYKGYVKRGLEPGAALARAISEREVSMKRLEVAQGTGYATNLLHSYLEQVGVLCLSERGKSTLMWSHYADKHRGICLGFDALSPFFVVAHPIFYSQLRPVVRRFMDPPDAQIVAALGTKDEVWQYEKERRIVKIPPEIANGASRVQVYPQEALRIVLLGARISEADRQAVAEWLDGRDDVKVYGLKLDAATFRLRTVLMKFSSQPAWDFEPA